MSLPCLCAIMLADFSFSQTLELGEFKLTYPNGLLQEEGVRTETKTTGTQYWYDSKSD